MKNNAHLIIFGLVLALLVGRCTVWSVDQLKHGPSVSAKVLSLQQQQKLTGSESSIGTTFRYLVVTDKETFVVKNSFLNGKFNNSDLYFRLEVGKTYDFRVAGFGKGYFTDYRNILSYKQSEQE